MELLDTLRILRRRWLPAVLTALVVAGLFALLPTKLMPLPPSTAVTEITLRLNVNGTDEATITKHKAQLDDAATSDSTLVEARNLANVTPQYMNTGAKLTWRGPTTFDITYDGPEREQSLALAKYYTQLVSDLDSKIIPGTTVTAESTRDVVANQRVLPQEEKLGRKALSIPLGIVAGVICGLIAAFVANALDRRVRGVQDIPAHGLTDAQVLGEHTPAELARVLSGRGIPAVSLRAADESDDGDVAGALRDAGIAVAEDAPALVVARRGVAKSELRAALDSVRSLAGVALLR